MTSLRLSSFATLLTLTAGLACSSASPNSDPNSTMQVPGGGGALGAAGSTGVGGTAGSTAMGMAGVVGVAGSGGAMGTAGTGGQAGAPAAGAGGMSGGTGGDAAGGMSGGGGTAGAAGQSGGAGAGGLGKGPSAACGGAIAPDPLVDPVKHDMMVSVAAQYDPVYVPRYYYTNLPSTWNPATPYPVIMYGNGCGQTGPEGGPFAGQEDYIYVQLIPASVTADTVEPPGGSPGCFQAGRKGTADSPDGPYFDQVLAEVAATYCIDLDQIYVAGWSSGSWLSNWLACARGGVIKSTVAGSGGLYENHGTCQPGTAAMIFAGDAASTQEDGFDIGAEYARDTLVMTNGCDMVGTTMAFGGANNCEYHGNCTLGAPVVYCTDGGGHGGPLGFMKDAGLAFWATLP